MSDGKSSAVAHGGSGKLRHVSMGTNIKKRLFLGNLPDGINDKDIRSRFSKFGQVNNVDIKVKKVSDERESSTFAFVELSVPSESQLQQCVNKLDGSDINGNSIRVQVAKESFLSRLQAEREQSKKHGSKTYEEKSAPCEEQSKTNFKEDRKYQDRFENNNTANSGTLKRRQGNNAAATDYNPLQMLKDRQQKNAVIQEEPVAQTTEQARTSPSKKSWNKKSQHFSSQNDDETEEFKGGLPKFGGTKSLTSSTKKEAEPSKATGKGSLMSQLENYGGIWNDQDTAPVEVDYKRKRRFDTTEDESGDGNLDTFQQKPLGQKRAKSTTIEDFTEKEEKPAPITDEAPKHKTYGDEQKKKELDNQKRIMSLQQRNDALKAQQNLIKSALKLTSETQNKKKIFFDTETTEAAPHEDTGKIQKKPAKHSEKKPKLFDDDDDDEDIEGYANDFKSRPQFDTEQGQELLELQSRFGRDQRFKLDHRFTDNGDDAEPEPENTERDEKDRQMAILGSIVPLGPALAQSNDSAKNRIKSKAFVRFDPNAKDHEKFEKAQAPVVKDDKGKKKGKYEPAESAPLPEVSSERFYQTAGPLEIGRSEGFSLRSMFQGSAEDDVEDEEQVEQEQKKDKPETKETQKAVAPAVQPEQQGYWKNAGMWHEQLFFQDNDSRLKEALDFIKNPSKEEPYADRAKWAEFRDKLRYFYRNKMRRHTIWAEGPTRQQKKTTQPEQVDETAFQFYGQPDATKKKKPHRTYYK